MLERERAILTVLYVILSGPAYGKSSTVTIAGSERKTDGKKKKKKREILARYQLNPISNLVI